MIIPFIATYMTFTLSLLLFHRSVDCMDSIGKTGFRRSKLSENTSEQSLGLETKLATRPQPKKYSIYDIKQVKKYSTVQERIEAKRRDESKYQKQFTDQGIAEKKKILQGVKLEEFLGKAERYRERHRQEEARRAQKRKQEGVVRLRSKNKKPRPPSPAENKAAEIRAANSAALSQLSTTPKFMQKLKEETTAFTTVKKATPDKGMNFLLSYFHDVKIITMFLIGRSLVIILVTTLPFFLSFLSTGAKKAISKTNEQDIVPTSDHQSNLTKKLRTTSYAEQRRAWKTRIQRVQKYKSLEERHEAKRSDDRKYRKQFTQQGIEKAKKTLKGEELDAFLKRAHHFRESRSARTQKSRRRGRADVDESNQQKLSADVRAIDVRAANAAALSQLPRRWSFDQRRLNEEAHFYETQAVSYLYSLLCYPFVYCMDVEDKSDTRRTEPSESISGLSHGSANLADGSQSKKLTLNGVKRVQKYSTVQGRTEAQRGYESKYERQFTDQGIADLYLLTIRSLIIIKEEEDLTRYKGKAERYRERRRQQARRARRSKQEEGGSVRIRDKKPRPLSPAEKKAAEIRAANSSALSQLIKTPKFMQKLEKGATSSSIVPKSLPDKGAK
ncbi:uncharacterized protein FA14DRAFT_152295 [Meira miltonrushii]|uniref:Uncharacterized protein n=1 Tax=Meira miltonrushii TaxID=1280837 RepID=A0A316VKL1_9BASI|nr:uncharacterized protein FA14DRAFT_152295 [Meira miltonrushii]PWN36873.1 hypothetical protein FA14DRAFT_152295 [Meira miltonrushii]